MSKTLPARLDSDITLSFCQKLVPDALPISVALRPEVGSPLAECFSIVPEHIATHGGEQLNGWVIWQTDSLIIEAEFHAIWRSTLGELVDLTPRPFKVDAITFLPDPKREYRGCQVDNIRQALTSDRDVIRYIHLASRMVNITNKGDLAYQHGEVTLPPRAFREYRKLEKEMAQLQRRFRKRFKGATY